jgi:hypothetical protein
MGEFAQLTAQWTVAGFNANCIGFFGFSID